MVKFSDDDKKVSEFSGGKYFDEGVFEVEITDVKLGTTEKDSREFLEFSVVGIEENSDRSDSVRFWFSSPGAINFSFNRIREMFVHAAEESKKDETRTKFDAIPDTDKLEAAAKKVLVGTQQWLKVEQNTSRTYQKDGETKYSFDKNLTGYQPSLKKSTGDTPPNNTQPISTVDDDGNEQLISEF